MVKMLMKMKSKIFGKASACIWLLATRMMSYQKMGNPYGKESVVYERLLYDAFQGNWVNHLVVELKGFEILIVI